jgi:hypothetical protein
MNEYEHNYDPANDVLYVTVGKPRPSYGEDLLDGVIARYDMETNELSGVTILDCSARFAGRGSALSGLFRLLNGIDFDACISAKSA